MPEKIKLSDFYDFSDSDQLERFKAVAQGLVSEYNTSIKDLSISLKDIKKAQKDYFKTLSDQETLLKNATAITKEGREEIAKSAMEIEKTAKAYKTIQAEERKVSTEKDTLNKKVKDLEASLKKLQDTQAKAVKATQAEAGSIADLKTKVNEAQKAYEALGKDIDPVAKTKALQNLRSLKKELDDANKSMKANPSGIVAGSYNALDQEVKDLVKDLKQMPDTFGKNKAAAEKLQSTIAKKTQTLKDFDKGILDNRRNVGNYADSLKEAALNSNLFGGRIAQAAQGLQSLQGGLKTAQTGFSGLRVAIISTGIGALLVAFGALVALFTKTDAGGERLERIFAGIGAVVEFLIGNIVKLGENLLKVFDNIGPALANPMQTLKDFSSFIQTNLLNRVKAFGVAIEAIKNLDFVKLNDAFIQLGTGIEDASSKFKKFIKEIGASATEAKKLFDAAVEIKRGFQELEDAERLFGVQTERNRGLIEQLIKSSKDRALSEEDRYKSLQKAGRLETEETQRQMKLATQRLNLILKENQLKTKLSFDEVASLTTVEGALEKLSNRRGTLLDDDLDKQAEAQKELIKIQNASLLQQQDIKNRESKLLEEITKEEFDAFQKRNELILKKGRLSSKNLAPPPVVTFDLDGALARNELLYNKQLIMLKETRNAGLITERQYEKSAEDLLIQSLRRRLELLQEAKASETDIIEAKLALVEATEKKQTEIRKREADLRAEIEKTATQLGIELANLPFENGKIKREEEARDLQAQREYELDLAGDNAKEKDRINKEFDKKEKKLRREQAVAEKEQALFNIGLNTAVAAIKALSVTPLPAGAGILALTIALGALQAALVLAKPVPKFARGTENAPEGWAIVDEEGPELRVSKGKAYIGSDKGPRFAWLNKGDKIKTASETKRLLETSGDIDLMGSLNQGHNTLSKIEIGERIDYDKLASKLSPSFENLGSIIKNKRELSLNITKNGMTALVKEGENITEYLGSKFGISI